MSKLTFRWMVALSFIVAIFVCIAGVSIGQEAAPATTTARYADVPTAPTTGNAPPTLVINEVMPLWDNEHFGLTNPGTAKVNLEDYQVSIDRGVWIKLPTHDLGPGEEVNVLFDPKAKLSEPGQDNVYIGAAGLTLNDRSGTVTVKDDAGVVSELTYNLTQLT